MSELPADPVALRSAFLHRGFVRYLRWSLPRRFHGVRVAREGVPHPEPGRPLIVYCNHPSWWDPAIMFVLGETLLPAWQGYAPMEAEALKQYGVMRKLGVFGLEPGAKGAVRFLLVADHVLSDSRRALWITAEGRFTDARIRPVRIRPGIAHLARRAACATILPLALDFTFWNESKPEALARFGKPMSADGSVSVAAWQARLETALEATMEALSADAVSRDPARFVSLLDGRTGVGGVYDGWRRAASWARLRRFDPSHER
ncbi:MAG TPA: lysophospholipid acyltransferase family protein [Acidisphaera sp.]|nr:lysophospholipid acyltransferase family protein [Acidisphaera sp.]